MKIGFFAKALFGLTVSFCVNLGGVAWAASDTRDGGYSVYFVDAPLDLALRILGRDLGVEFALAGSPRQRLRDLTFAGAKEEVIAQLLAETGMDGFAFNGQVHISPQTLREVRLVRLGDVPAPQAMTALKDAGLLLPEFDVTEVAGGGAIVLSGPVKYLALSESIIASLVAEPAVVATPVRVRRAGKLETDGVNIASDGTAEN